MKTVSKGRPAPLTPDERLKVLPFAPSHSSVGLGWGGIRAEYFPLQPGTDLRQPPLVSLCLVLLGTTIRRGEFECDGLFAGEALAGTVTVIPPGAESRYRWGSDTSSTHFQLSDAFVRRVASEACDLDPASICFPATVWDRLHPSLHTDLNALHDELLSGGVGGRLCAESLANVLVVHLLRHLASGHALRGETGRLARHALRAVEEYINDNLAADITLADLAGVVHLSEYHFARLFKATTGQPPHQYIIQRRVERAKQHITEGRLTLAQVAAAVGFTDQSHFTRHFKKLVGVTPKRFG